MKTKLKEESQMEYLTENTCQKKRLETEENTSDSEL